jgi:DNA (cytosine-5)-methyltransferase 1
MSADGRQIPIIVLENVVGALTSHGGRDFLTIVDALVRGGYDVGGLVIDAAYFVPQSRPRLFMLAVQRDAFDYSDLQIQDPVEQWTPKALRRAHWLLSPRLAAKWVWWNLPAPPDRTHVIDDLIEEDTDTVEWHAPEQTDHLLTLMNSRHRSKVEEACLDGRRRVGTVYRRTRPDGRGGRCQRAEVRFDGVAGCLRTPAGGSSRQTVMVVEGSSVRTRLLSAREAARLMGLPEWYELPDRYNAAYHLIGDGLCVNVVDWLARQLLEPLAARVVNGRASSRRR